MRVIVTRPATQADKWVTGLRAAGLDALSLPLIEIGGPPDARAVRAVWQMLAHWQVLMFVSSNAVAHFFAQQPADASGQPMVPSLWPRLWATGPGTVDALVRAGVPMQQIDAPPPHAAQFDSEALWQVAGARVEAGWRACIVRGDVPAEDSEACEGTAAGDAAQGQGRDWLAAQLRQRGATVDFVVAYVRRAPKLQSDAHALLRQAAADGSVWLFSSSEAVANLQRIAPGQSWQQARAVATHARIAQAARAAGFGWVHESRPALADLLASIESLA